MKKHIATIAALAVLGTAPVHAHNHAAGASSEKPANKSKKKSGPFMKFSISPSLSGKRTNFSVTHKGGTNYIFNIREINRGAGIASEKNISSADCTGTLDLMRLVPALTSVYGHVPGINDQQLDVIVLDGTIYKLTMKNSKTDDTADGSLVSSKAPISLSSNTRSRHSIWINQMAKTLSAC